VDIQCQCFDALAEVFHQFRQLGVLIEQFHDSFRVLID
jgi:hypothetical protein